ncbi:hypothetical protein WH47_01438 [Habropoda laboriosa]|uniref:Histone-lysine N-methyltransferase SETMAR n=1 Tax=Habropoda laboriosa TaxID=597456 RepID=A0A0L7R5A3_9HYME|nr:hypothetical protein WH47_01438 [Habropoda laboriosa]
MLWHRDNAPAYSAILVKVFLNSKSVTMLERPVYSPDLSPCDFFILPRVEVMKGAYFVVGS